MDSSGIEPEPRDLGIHLYWLIATEAQESECLRWDSNPHKRELEARGSTN